MEEQKTKEVSLEAAKGQEQQKYSPEQLKEICNRLIQENQYLKQQVQQANKILGTFNRLDYLFRVVEISSKTAVASEYPCFAKEFVGSCIEEIQLIMTAPAEDSEENKKES